ncbi:serine/threonine-protein phosphatase [Streptomyces sp. AD16]|nr:serine/threonine-protein phosphatase [Streptomyces sp. AD16]
METTGSYVPAEAGAEIGGDWFDAIALPSLRTGLVVGDVFGSGLHATATMGRLRTAVQTLADLELAPDEVLTQLDTLVARLAAEAEPGHRDTVGATCLVALHDPVTRRCVMASAGHPPPILALPGGPAEPVDLQPGPPLGVGGCPSRRPRSTPRRAACCACTPTGCSGGTGPTSTPPLATWPTVWPGSSAPRRACPRSPRG